jgi:hypothetical protein
VLYKKYLPNEGVSMENRKKLEKKSSHATVMVLASHRDKNTTINNHPKIQLHNWETNPLLSPSQKTKIHRENKRYLEPTHEMVKYIMVNNEKLKQIESNIELEKQNKVEYKKKNKNNLILRLRYHFDLSTEKKEMNAVIEKNQLKQKSCKSHQKIVLSILKANRDEKFVRHPKVPDQHMIKEQEIKGLVRKQNNIKYQKDVLSKILLKKGGHKNKKLAQNIYVPQVKKEVVKKTKSRTADISLFAMSNAKTKYYEPIIQKVERSIPCK